MKILGFCRATDGKSNNLRIDHSSRIFVLQPLQRLPSILKLGDARTFMETEYDLAAQWVMEKTAPILYSSRIITPS
jgi:hypothetical protein